MIFDLLRDLIHLLPLSLAICLGLFSDPKIPAVLLCLCSDFLFLFLLVRGVQERGRFSERGFGVQSRQTHFGRPGRSRSPRR